MNESFDRIDNQHSSLMLNSAVDFTSADARALFAPRTSEENNVTHVEFSNIYAAPSHDGNTPTISTSQRQPLINSALRLSAVSQTADNVAAVNAIVQHESSWNPQAVNVTDSNAEAGHPSRGLMQTIPSTFEKYALPGYDRNICDPLSNLIAGIRYAVNRYGSLEQVPGVRALARNGNYQGY